MATSLPDLVTLTVRIAGEELGQDYEVIGLSVRKEVNRIPSARIVLLDGNVASRDFPRINEPKFRPFSEIELDAGYHSQESTIFKGLIVRNRISAKSQGRSQLVIDCKDAAIQLTAGAGNACFYEKTDDAVIAELFKAASIDCSVDATDVVHDTLVQFNVTPWDFALVRAEANGLIVLANDGQVDVVKPDADAQPKATFVFGLNLLELDMQYEPTLNKKTASATWDPSTQSVLTTPDLDNDDGLFGETQLHHGSIPETELQAWADAAFSRDKLAEFRGCVQVQGDSTVLPGDVIELEGLGEEFSSKFFVSAVSHRVERGEWLTDLQVGLAREWFYERIGSSSKLANGLTPFASGLHVGVVTEVEAEPDNGVRVRVKLPLIDEEGEGIWARVARLDAGAERGIVFHPELNDEVVVSFANNDPRAPIILGMLHSGSAAPPFEVAEGNSEKGIVTREGLQIVFNDDAKKLKLSTPTGNSIELDEESKSIKLFDQNENTIELTDNGVTLRDKSGNTIQMSSNGISLESAKDLVLKATGNVQMEGINVEAAANGQFKAAGNAGAELTSSGIAVLKGSLVKIN